MAFKFLRRASGRAHGEAVAGAVIARLTAPATGIDAKDTVIEPTLYTVPAGVTIVVTGVRLRCTAADLITTPAEAGVGIGAGLDDIFASQPLLGLTAADKAFDFAEGGSGVIANEGDIIKLGIDVAAIGTSQTLEADIFGYEV